MGKAQSKRSVDITTETKEGVAAEGDSGKVGKIEDIDQVKPQLNGDANKDAESAEKLEEKKDENEKDAVTEKKDEPAAESTTAAAATTTSTETTEAKPTDGKPTENGDEAATKPTENGDGTETADTTLNESKDAVETGDDATSPNDSAKKPKKEKSKKRFLSFRSFSFSKKDKSKPKNDAANTTNGEIEKVPEEANEEAAAVTNGDDKAETEPTTNGTSEDVKVNGAPVATPEESVTPPPASDDKPIAEIKQVAEETVKEAIVAASKSVDDKINAIVAKPEVNEPDSQNENTSTTQAIDTSVELIENDSSENSEQVPNNIDNNETSIQTQSIQKTNDNENENENENANANINEMKTNENVMDVPVTPPSTPLDCTNTDQINNFQQNSEPPALPECPPPSQITVFAETAMSVDPIAQIEDAESNVEMNESIPVDDNEKINHLKAADQELHEKLISDLENLELEPQSKVAINATDDSKQMSSNIGDEDSVEPMAKDDNETEISSLLQQNSLESLPSAQSSSETPLNEIDDIATDEQNDNLLPPPPADLIDNETESTTELPPPIESIDDINDPIMDTKNGHIDDDEDDEMIATTNGGADLLNGSSHTNTNGNDAGHNHDHNDDAAIDHSEKENGVATNGDNSVSEKMNGDSDHKTIEEIATSPEKLEKLAAANHPPSTEIVAAE